MKKLFFRFLISIILSVGLSISYLSLPTYFDSIDKRLRDFMFILRGPIDDSGNIVIVDVDEVSLKSFGQWPWSRNLISELLLNLAEAEVGIIGLDIFFPEADARSPHTIAKDINLSSVKLANYDRLLAKTFERTPTVGGYFFNNQQEANAGETPLIPAVFIEKNSVGNDYLYNFNSVTLNLPVLQDSLYSSGFLNTIIQSGGITRSSPLIIRHKGEILPSLDLEMYRIYNASQEVYIHYNEQSIDTISLNNNFIPVDLSGRLLINYRGPAHTFEYISAKDILNKNFKKEDLEGKFVYIGTSAVGLVDNKVSVFDETIPGVEIHANILDNLLMQDFISEQIDQVLLTILSIFILSFFSFLLYSKANGWFMFPLFFLLGYGCYFFINYMLFTEGIILNILFPFITIVLSLILSVYLEYISASRQKEMVMRAFAKKVSPAVMNRLIKHTQETLLAPSEKTVTIFFSDIRSFTTISEEIGSPKKLISMLNQYMTPVVNNIISHHGTVDKFIGDAVMAYWNAPLDISNHADEAVSSALEQIVLLKELNKSIKDQFNIEIEIGIGIHTGEVTIGDMGSAGRSDFTIIGDNVNLASRLEGLTKMYGVNIIISAQTKEQLKGDYHFLPLDSVIVKGKSQAVEVFEVRVEPLDKEEEDNYLHALNLYRQGKVVLAHESFKKLNETYACILYELYFHRCGEHLEDEKFNPITTMKSK